MAAFLSEPCFVTAFSGYARHAPVDEGCTMVTYCHNQNNCWAICPVVHVQDLQLWKWSPMQLNLDVPSFFGYPAFRELLMLWTLALDHLIPSYSLSPGSNVGDLLIAAASVVEDFDLARTSHCHCHAIMYCWAVRGIGSKDMSSCTTPTFIHAYWCLLTFVGASTLVLGATAFCHSALLANIYAECSLGEAAGETTPAETWCWIPTEFAVPGTETKLCSSFLWIEKLTSPTKGRFKALGLGMLQVFPCLPCTNFLRRFRQLQDLEGRQLLSRQHARSAVKRLISDGNFYVLAPWRRSGLCRTNKMGASFDSQKTSNMKSFIVYSESCFGPVLAGQVVKWSSLKRLQGADLVSL